MTDFARLLTLKSDDLAAMSIKVLTETHNQICQDWGVGKILKKFETKAQGVARILTVIEAANEAHRAELAKVQPIAEDPATKPKAPRAKSSEPRAKRPSVSGRCQELILSGQDNASVWATVKAEFGLDESKKHYPGWNRAMLVRTGKLKA